jgi:hypothetical protein
MAGVDARRTLHTPEGLGLAQGIPGIRSSEDHQLSISLLFPAYNRLAYTQQSSAALMANTDWSLVSEFHVYDDGSELDARVWLHGAALSVRIVSDLSVKFHATSFRSPMGVTLDWIKSSTAPFLAKLDNDTIYPPGWLNVALDVMKRNQDLDMLGLECMRQPVPAVQLMGRGYLPASYVSGLFLGRRKVFEKGLPADGGYFGLEEFQQERKIKAGWILPSLPVFLLDRMPTEPWASLSAEYVRKGWQRSWSLALRYKLQQHEMWDWWTPA